MQITPRIYCSRCRERWQTANLLPSLRAGKWTSLTPRHVMGRVGALFGARAVNSGLFPKCEPKLTRCDSYLQDSSRL